MSETLKKGFPLLVAIAITGYLYLRTPYEQECEFYSMGGILTEVKGYDTSGDIFQEVCSDIQNQFEYYESILSNYRAGSILSQINRGEHPPETPLPEEMFMLLGESKRISSRTGGYFDITILPLVELWKKAGENNRYPTSGEISKARSLVGSDKITLKANKISPLPRGMKIDLGAIAKGFMIDQAATLMQKKGIQRGLINSGGDIVAFDLTPQSKPFTIGIYNPDDPGNSSTFEIINGSIVTSGNYNRSYQIEGKAYSHIINPHTGTPENGCHSITVTAPTGLIADAWATGLCLMGDGSKARAIAQAEGVKIIEFRKQEF